MLFLLIHLSAAVTTKFIPSTKSPPSQRFYSFLDYLPSRSSLILFGGSDGPNYFNDLFEFSLETSSWKQVVPLSSDIPRKFYSVPRVNFGGFASEIEEKIYIFGGRTVLGPENDLWVFDFTFQKWEKLVTKSAPTPRSLFGCTNYIEEENEYFIIQGGITTEQQVNSIYR
jgi:N-acetylneuraminic acid mutarotase